MRRILITLALSALLAADANAATRIIDGDTLVVGQEKIRIANIDAPEIHRSKCDAERRLGLVAKERLRELVAGRPLTITRGDRGRMKDKYGRTLAVIAVDGRDVGDVLVEEQLARPWTGKRRPWCDQAEN